MLIMMMEMMMTMMMMNILVSNITISIFSDFIENLPDGFYNSVATATSTMSVMSKQNKAHLWISGYNQWKLELEPLFVHELCIVPSSLVDGNCVLQKNNVWTCQTPGCALDTATNCWYCHSVNSSNTLGTHLEVSIWPNRPYWDSTLTLPSHWKSHDFTKIKVSLNTVIDYDLSITSPLPQRSAVLKSKKAKQRLGNLLCSFSVGEVMKMDSSCTQRI